MPDNIQNNQLDPEAVSNAVLAVKLDFIQTDITTIKADIKEIKTDYIARREYDIRHSEALTKIELLQKKESDLEADVVKLNAWQNKIVGGLILLNILLGIFIAYYHH